MDDLGVPPWPWNPPDVSAAYRSTKARCGHICTANTWTAFQGRAGLFAARNPCVHPASLACCTTQSFEDVENQGCHQLSPIFDVYIRTDSYRTTANSWISASDSWICSTKDGDSPDSWRGTSCFHRTSICVERWLITMD